MSRKTNKKLPVPALAHPHPRGAAKSRQLPRLAGRPSERAGHSATTAHLQAAYPFMAESPLTSAGVLIGHDAYGASFVYDPWTLYEAGHVTGPNMVVVGIIGRGKSALLKSYLYRQRVFGREAWVVDPKGEFRALAEAFGCEPISLRPGGEMRLNPLTRRGGSHGQQSLLRSVAQAALARPLKPEEDAGLRVALARADRDALPAEPTLPDVVEALLKPDTEMARTLVTSEAELAAGCREAALALQRLCEGDLRGMFDGQTSAGIDLDASCVVIDLSAVSDSQAMGILMTCATAWQRGIVLDRKRRSEQRGEIGAKQILLLDEAWRATSHVGITDYLQQSFKLSRDLGVQNVIVLHRLSDLAAAGAAGSRERTIAEGLLADAETKVVLAQTPDELEQIGQSLALTKPELELVPDLARGEALWQIGQRTFYVRHTLSRFEWPLIDTDARMRAGQKEAA